MLNHQKIKMICTALAGGFLLLQATQAYAWDRNDRRHEPDHRYYREHRHYPFGGRELALSNGFFSIFVGNSRYYVCDDIFYNKTRYGYVVIAPPAGAVISELPSYYKMVMFNGIVYYTNDGIYYQYTPQGYVVVEQPVVIPAPAQPVQAAVPAQAPAVPADNSFTVNIPNAKGDYTSVTIKRSGTGFVGPQGEFYPEFPKVDQLKVMYGK